MNRILLILLLLSTKAFTQSHEEFMSDFLQEARLNEENDLLTYNKYDFHKIWTQTPNRAIVGIIGSTHERIKIKLIAVDKGKDNPNIYNVTGKSSVKGNVCDFKGTITLKEIRTIKELHYGVDNIYADSNIVAQGVIVAEYHFDENAEQRHTGVFKGTLYSKWYLDSTGKIKYDDIQSISDSYLNNAFVGTWTSYGTRASKLCNWADYRVPLANSDFDVGAGEFSPDDTYHDNGWKTYSQAWVYGDKAAREEELSEWWK